MNGHLTEPITVQGHRGELTFGDEFTVRTHLGRKLRLRFAYATRNPAHELELTGHDGHGTRTFAASSVLQFHRTRKVGKGISAPPPARRRGR